MKRLLQFVLVAGLMVFATSAAYAALKSDDFNDDSRDMALWNLYQENPSKVWLDETNQRLELRSTADANYTSVYVANGWGFSPTNNFSFKADFHNSLTSEGFYTWAAVMLGIGKGSDLATISGNNAGVDAGWDRGGEGYEGPYRVFNYYYSIDGNESESSFHETRDSNDGTLYVSYDTLVDELYLSHTGYWKVKASDTISGLLNGTWSGDVVTPFLGGDAENVALASGEAYLDNFVVDSGTIVLIPEPATIGLLGLGALSLIRKKK